MRITWVADHFIYLPMIGVIALACGGAVSGYERSPARLRPMLLAVGDLVAVAYSLLSCATASHWADEDRLREHTLARGLALLGEQTAADAHLAAAIERFRLTLTIAPHFEAARMSLPLARGEEGDRGAEKPD
jgi:hypothetical protein